MCATMQKLRMCSSFKRDLWVLRDAGAGTTKYNRNSTLSPSRAQNKKDCFRSPFCSTDRWLQPFAGGGEFSTGLVIVLGGAGGGDDGRVSVRGSMLGVGEDGGG